MVRIGHEALGTVIQDTMDLNKDPLDINNLMENILNSMSYWSYGVLAKYLIAYYIHTGILPDQDSEPKQMLHQNESSSYCDPLSYHGWPNHPYSFSVHTILADVQMKDKSKRREGANTGKRVKMEEACAGPEIQFAPFHPLTWQQLLGADLHLLDTPGLEVTADKGVGDNRDIHVK